MNAFREFFCLLCFAAVSAKAVDSFPSAAHLPIHTEPPDPLVMFDGQPVKTKEDWFQKRRPELRALFEHYEYGVAPPPASVKAVTGYTDTNAFGGTATLRCVTLALGASGKPHVHLLLVIPNHRGGPAPVFMGMNFSGNHTLVTDTNVPLPAAWTGTTLKWEINHHAGDDARGKFTNVWHIPQTIDRGYAVATYFCSDIEMDVGNPKGGVQEIIESPDSPNDWGRIAAWAWGMQRVVDYLITNPDIDAKKIAAVGHSRFGKATLLAGALDERIALVIPLQSGCGGAAPCRGETGESVKQINTKFPLWFCGEFSDFNDWPERLPFDQHCLIAMCAPRPVLLGAATDDQLTDPAGSFDMLKAADKVYRFVGAGGLDADVMPPENKLIDGTLGYFIRAGKHSMTRLDWQMFLDFADKHFGKPAQ